MNKLFSLVIITVVLAACGQNEPPTDKLSKDHSIEVTYQTQRLNNTSVLLIRNEHVYLHGKMIKSFFRTDTLPSPGDTIHTVEQDDETTQKIPAPKEYEFFVTVK
jgi:hypothetical protein